MAFCAVTPKGIALSSVIKIENMSLTLFSPGKGTLYELSDEAQEEL